MLMSQEQIIEANIARINASIISELLKASEAQVCGATKTTQCHLDKVFELVVEKEKIESLCPTNVVKVNENIELLCDPTKRGIGEWAIERSARGCGVFTVAYSQQPPPYGEFAFCEFQTNNFTEPIGDTSTVTCN